MNLLFICTDQHRWDCLSCLGHPVVRTPNLDALAADATLFTSAYAATAPCAPSRASILTGQYPDGHGVTGGMDDLAPPDQPILPQHLQAAGVHTALVGKLHLHPFHRDYGFDLFERADGFFPNYLPDEVTHSAYLRDLRRRLPAAAVDAYVAQFEADESSYQTDQYRFIVGRNVVPEADHPTTWTVDRAIQYLQTERPGTASPSADTGSAAPFFLNVSIYGPHQPYAAPAPWDTLYDPDTLPLPADFHAPLDDKPIIAGCGFYKESRELRRRQGWTEATYRRALAAYYGNISMIDHHLGRLFATLREQGLWEDTVIVFTADHGDMGGQFQSFFKSLAYEGSAHVPLIIRDPRSPRQGRREARPVGLVDLYATCLEHFGVDAPDAPESRSLLPMLHGPARERKAHTWFKQGTNAAIIDGHWKLIRDSIAGQTRYELYDLRESPREFTNRIADPALAELLASLRARLDLWYEEQTQAPALAIPISN